MYNVELLNESFSEAINVRLTNNMGVSHKELTNLVCANKCDSIHVFKTEKNFAIGYLIYAKISKNLLKLLEEMSGVIPFHYEWSEGKILYVIDVVFLQGYRRESRRQLFEFLKKQKMFCHFKKGKLVVYLKREGNHRKVELF